VTLKGGCRRQSSRRIIWPNIQIRHDNRLGDRRVFLGLTTPPSHRGRSQRPPHFWAPTYAHTVRPGATNSAYWHRLGIAVYTGSSTSLSEGAGPQLLQIFGTSCMRAQTIWEAATKCCSTVIKLDEWQIFTRWTMPTACHGQNFVTRMLTCDLFAIDNLLVNSFFYNPMGCFLSKRCVTKLCPL